MQLQLLRVHTSAPMAPRSVDMRKYLRNCHTSDVGEPFELGVDAGTFEGDDARMQILRLLVRLCPMRRRSSS